MEGNQRPQRVTRNQARKQGKSKSQQHQKKDRKSKEPKNKLKSRVSLIEEELELEREKEKKPSKLKMKLEKFTSFRDYQRPKQGRIYRALTQRMYLLKAEQINQNEWTFEVMGSRGVPYQIVLTDDDFKCQCHDFYTNGGQPCKHLVAQVNELYEKIQKSKRIKNKDHPLISKYLKQRLNSRLGASKIQKTEDNKEVELGDDKDCAICFEQLKVNSNNLEQCTQCKKYFHKECITAWKTKNTTCPLCRHDLTASHTKLSLQEFEGNSKDALCFLKKVKLV